MHVRLPLLRTRSKAAPFMGSMTDSLRQCGLPPELLVGHAALLPGVPVLLASLVTQVRAFLKKRNFGV